MTSDSENAGRAPHDVRVPIMRQLHEYDPDPDHVRGAKYANLLLGTDFEQGDVVRVVYLDHVEPAFFDQVEQEQGLDAQRDPLYAEFKRNPDVICVADLGDLPAEFHPETSADGGGA